MHLKNFNLITRENKVELSFAYDLLNTTIIMRVQDEIAVPIRGKKKKLKYDDIVNYFGLGRLKLSELVINNELSKFEQVLKHWDKLIIHSFLSEKRQDSYRKLIDERWQRLH